METPPPPPMQLHQLHHEGPLGRALHRINSPAELKQDIIAQLLDDSERFNAMMRKYLGEVRSGAITTERFMQLRNNAKGNALDDARRASRHCMV